MNKKFIVRKNEEIQEIIKKNKKIINKYYIIYIKNNTAIVKPKELTRALSIASPNK